MDALTDFPRPYVMPRTRQTTATEVGLYAAAVLLVGAATALELPRR